MRLTGLGMTLREVSVEHQAVEGAGNGSAGGQGEGGLVLVQVNIIQHQQKLSEAPVAIQTHQKQCHKCYDTSAATCAG